MPKTSNKQSFIARLLASLDVDAPVNAPAVVPVRIAPTKLVGACLEREEGEAVFAVNALIKTSQLISDEIKRLTGELHATNVALEARKAALAIYANEIKAQTARVDASLADFDFDDYPDSAPMVPVLEEGLRDALAKGEASRADPAAFAAANRARLANEKRNAAIRG